LLRMFQLTLHILYQRVIVHH